MLAISGNYEEIIQILNPLKENFYFDIAAINSPKQIVLSGEYNSLENVNNIFNFYILKFNNNNFFLFKVN